MIKKANNFPIKASLLLIFIICSFYLPVYAKSDGQAKPTWTAVLSIDNKAIFSVDISPDGEKTLIGYVDKNSELEGNNRFLVISNKTNEVLLRTPPGKDYSEGKWSPNGKWISLVRIRYKNEQQIEYILEVTPEDHYSPFKICSLSFLRTHQWAPNGKRIAFIADVGRDLQTEQKVSPPYIVEGMDIAHEMRTILTSMGLTIVDIDFEGKRVAKPYSITPTSFTINSDRGNWQYSWSPDSERLAFSFIPIDSLDDYKNMRLSLVEVKTRKIKDLSYLGAAFDPVFSPDGKYLAYVGSSSSTHRNPIKNTDLYLTELTICLLDLSTEEKRCLGKTPNERPKIIGWLSDGAHLLIEDEDHTTNRLYSVPIDGKEPFAFPMKAIKNFFSACLNTPGTHIGMVGENLRNPPEVYVSSIKNFSLTQISNFHEDFPKFPEIKTEIITWQSFDGMSMEGILVYPVGYEEGQKMPLIVKLHGGPPEGWKEGYLGFPFEGSPSPAFLAAYGYGVFIPNVRGSNGYGANFRQAIYKDWGNGPFKDIMTGIDVLIKRGIVDADKLGIEGWSYGGYLAAFSLTQTNRFKAAVISAGETNLISYASNAETSSLIRSYYGGDFWEDYKAWISTSPIMYVENITTPTFIQHGDEDTIVPGDQSYGFYRALKVRNVPVRFVVYKGQGHGLGNEAAIRGSQDVLQWFDTYIKPFKQLKH